MLCVLLSIFITFFLIDSDHFDNIVITRKTYLLKAINNNGRFKYVSLFYTENLQNHLNYMHKMDMKESPLIVKHYFNADQIHPRPCCLSDEQRDECLSSPCQNEASCVDLLNGFQCACASGYTGVVCQTG